MKSSWLLSWMAFCCVAFAQEPTPPKGDIFQSGGPPDVQSAFRRLYQAAAQITASPSSGYQPPHDDQSDWPAVTAAQKGWTDSLAFNGGELTQAERNQLVPCAAHLNAAIDDMERGYRIQISQPSALAQRTVVSLYAQGRAEFAACNSTGTPSPPRSPLTGRVENDSSNIPDDVSPPLAALEKLADQLAPHYHMTRPDEGLRVIKDSLLALGFGALAKNAGPLLRALVSRTPVSPPIAPLNWASGTFAPLMSVRMPPGLSAPAILKTTPRPLYLQEKITSCSLACVKMMVATVKRESVPESFYRALVRRAPVTTTAPLRSSLYGPGQLTTIKEQLDLLRRAGLNPTLATDQTLQDLYNATRSGYPALAHLGDLTDGHSIIVDAVARDAASNWFVFARDPWNLDLLGAGVRQMFEGLGFRNFALYTEQEFLGPGGWSGVAIYTKP